MITSLTNEKIKEYANNHPEKTASQIASHFGCSRQYVSRIKKTGV